MFGQLVIGPPGSGKSTYCNGMQQFLESLGRKVAIVNIDPANDVLPYKCSVDISSLITLTDVMDNLKLGPNGGLIYCMEFLESNIQWLLTEINKLKDHYILIDCPGQVELYTHHKSIKNIVDKLIKMDVRLCAVHLVDSHYCTDPGKFVSVLLTSLSTMLQVELPYIHILSKADLMEKSAELHFNLEFYTEVLNLEYLLNHLADDPFTKKYKKLNEALIGIIEDYSLVSYLLLNIQNKQSVYEVVKAVDRANGYVFGEGEERNIQALLSSAVGADFQYFKNANIQEQFINMDYDLSKV